MIQSKPFDQLFGIFTLADKDVFVILFYLKPQKESKLPHEAYFELFLHKLSKILTQRDVRTTKSNVIDENLNNKQIQINFLDKKMVSMFPF